MTRVIIFGGTTEGRKLAELCAKRGIRADVCVVSDYGGRLLPHSEYLTIHTGGMEAVQMERLLGRPQDMLVFDATHPYAAVASENIRQACRNTGRRVIRVLRGESSGDRSGEVLCAASMEAAIAYLEQDTRPVLVTTGSRELGKFRALAGYQERIYARVLPSHEGITACEELGLPGSHIIAMQGPFSRRMNEALLEQTGAGWLVTKESGVPGGFMEKLAAAEALGVKTIVIGRPRPEDGIDLAAAGRMIAVLGDAGAERLEMAETENTMPEDAMLREAALVGIGMGGPELLTAEAISAIRAGDALLGAPRMVRAAAGINGRALTAGVYLPDDVCAWLSENPQIKKPVILFSGDPGFYSGAGGVRQALERSGTRWQIRTLPGISTVSYLCARLQTGWEDVHLCSLHGRDCDVAEQIRQFPRVFCLLGGRQPVRELCARLKGQAGRRLRITVGEWLSYPQERIVSGSPEELEMTDFSGFCAVLIERITEDEG